MLQNAYFLAKIGADTAENEQHFAEILPKTGNYPTGPPDRSQTGPPRPGARGRARPARAFGKNAFFENAFFENAFFENAFFDNYFVNFWRARSRLYQNEILQENMRLTAFFKLYKICILLHRCNLKISAKNRFEKSAIL